MLALRSATPKSRVDDARAQPSVTPAPDGHQAYLINPLHLTKDMRSDGGYLVMGDGTSVPLAKSKRDAFHAKFQV